MCAYVVKKRFVVKKLPGKTPAQKPDFSKKMSNATSDCVSNFNPLILLVSKSSFKSISHGKGKTQTQRS